MDRGNQGRQPVAGLRPDRLKGIALARMAEFRALADELEARRPEDLDQVIHSNHRKWFAGIDCLDCANCCRTTPVLLRQDDLDRLAAYLGMSVSRFMSEYVTMDEDGDFVTNGTPCPFLREDNRCGVYEARPGACRDYPLTLLEDQAAILGITLENTAVCPAVYRIFEELCRLYGNEGKKGG